jgi:peptidoglycan/xylan/chitin deacetylase (PgdA/CDA1 family)
MFEWLVEIVPNISRHLFNLSIVLAVFLLAYAIYFFIRSKYSLNLKKITSAQVKSSLKMALFVFLGIQLLIWIFMLQIDSETKAVPKKKIVIIEIDDFWNLKGGHFGEYGYSIENYESVIGRIEKRNFTATLGVVPYIFIENDTDILSLKDDEKMVEYLRSKKAKGHEIAMHGYAHCRNKYYCPEFEENYLNILQGKKEIDKVFGQETVTYLPPGNFWDDLQYANVEKNRFKIIGNTEVGRPYWDSDVLITPKGYDVVDRWDWYGGNNTHSPYKNWVDAYENADVFIVQLHCNTFDNEQKLDDLDRFLDYLKEDNATVVTYLQAYWELRR